MKFFQAINNFTAGEWSPKMHARTDTQQYQNAASKLRNAIVQIQGGSFMRPGTRFLEVPDPYATTLNAADEIRLVPYNTTTGSYFIVITDGPISSWFAVDGFGTVFLLDNVSGPELTDVVLDDEYVRELQFAQSGNTLVVTTGRAPPIAFIPGSGLQPIRMASWCVKNNGAGYQAYPTIIGYRKWEAIPYGPFENSTTKGSVVVTGTMTVGGAVSISFPYSAFNPFSSTFPFPKYIRVTASAATAVIEIQSNTNATTAQGVVVYNPNGVAAGTFGTAAGTFWELSVWGPVALINVQWPRCLTFFEQRVYFASTQEYPETFWGSSIGNIVRLMRVPYAQDADFTTFINSNNYPYSVTLASKETSTIVALSGVKSLVINTDASEAVAYTSDGSALGPLNVSIDTSTSFGSEKVQPFRVNNFLTFVQRGGRKIRDVVFSFEQDQYKSNDLAFVADHLTFGTDRPDKIVELAKIEAPSSTLYCRTETGKLLAVALDRDYQVNAWSPIVFGGALDGEDPDVKALGVMPRFVDSDANVKETLFVVVRRTIDGNEVTYIERMAYIYEASDAGNNFPPMYMDSIGVSTLGGLGSTILDNLDHLEGQIVGCIVDGLYLGTFVVTGGVVDCGKTYTIGYAGLLYDYVTTPLPVEAGTQLGSSMGITKRVDELTIRFWNTYGAEYGNERIGYTPIEFLNPNDPTGAPAKMFTGDKRVTFPADYARRAEVSIRQRVPFPCNVLAVISRGVTYD